METMKKNNKVYTATAILHLQKCKNNNPLMENRAWKGQISSTYVSLFLNYGRKSHDSWRDSHLFMGRAAGKCLMEMTRKSQENSRTMG